MAAGEDAVVVLETVAVTLAFAQFPRVLWPLRRSGKEIPKIARHGADHIIFSIFRPEGPRIAEIDSRLSDESQEQLIDAFNAINIAHDEMPLRPGYGTLGTPVKLRSNFFPIRVPKGPLYEYDVQISPSPGTSKRIKRRIFQLAEISTEWAQAGMKGFVAHDHAARLISAKELAQPLYIHTRYWEEDEEPTPNDKEYILTLTLVMIIETDGIVQCVCSAIRFQVDSCPGTCREMQRLEVLIQCPS